MRTTMRIAWCAAATMVLAGAAGAQTIAAGKTAILQVQNAVLNTREGHQGFSALDGRYAARKADLEKRQNDLAALQEQFRKQSATMSEDAQRKMARDIDKKTKALSYDAEVTQTEYEQEQNDLMQTLVRKMKAVVDKYARDKGFGVVMDVSNPQTQAFWWADAINITNEIVRAYDAAYPGNAPGSGEKQGQAFRISIRYAELGV